MTVFSFFIWNTESLLPDRWGSSAQIYEEIIYEYNMP